MHKVSEVWDEAQDYIEQIRKQMLEDSKVTIRNYINLTRPKVYGMRQDDKKQGH